jgi:hypothetical protein
MLLIVTSCCVVDASNTLWASSMVLVVSGFISWWAAVLEVGVNALTPEMRASACVVASICLVKESPRRSMPTCTTCSAGDQEACMRVIRAKVASVDFERSAISFISSLDSLRLAMDAANAASVVVAAIPIASVKSDQLRIFFFWWGICWKTNWVKSLGPNRWNIVKKLVEINGIGRGKNLGKFSGIYFVCGG